MKHLIVSAILVIATSIWLVVSDQSAPAKASLLIASMYLTIAALVLIANWIKRTLQYLRGLVRKAFTRTDLEIKQVQPSEVPAKAAQPYLTESRKIEIASAAVSSGLGLAAYAAKNGLKESSLREWVAAYLGEDPSNDSVTRTQQQFTSEPFSAKEQDGMSSDETDNTGESAALEIEFAATISCRFQECESLDDGSLYIAAIKIGSTVLYDNTLERDDLPCNGAFVPSSFWESEISYEYERDTVDEHVWIVRVSGSLAAEFDSSHLSKSGIASYDADTAISFLAVAWAEDGDSPKYVCKDPDLEECDVIDVNVIEEFVEYP